METIEYNAEMLQIDTLPLPTIAFFLLLALLVSHGLTRLSRVSGASRLRRWLPTTHLAIWTVAISTIIYMLAHYQNYDKLLVFAALLLIFIVSTQNWLRSLLAGIVLTWENRLHPGDIITVGNIHGEIIATTSRALQVRTKSGILHELPYETILREPLSIASVQGEVVCEMTLQAPSHLHLNQAMQIARDTAILSPLASPNHKPETFRTSPTDQTFTLRAYAFSTNALEHFRSDVLNRLNKAYQQ